MDFPQDVITARDFKDELCLWWRRKWQPTPVFLPGKIPQTEESGRLPSMGSQRVGHDWVTSLSLYVLSRPSLVTQVAKNPPATQETWAWSLGQEDPPEKETATHSSILDWKIPWTEEAGGLQFMGLQRIVLDWATNTMSTFDYNVIMQPHFTLYHPLNLSYA